MTLNTSLHEQAMKNILRDLLVQPQLQSKLVFKGGTCLMLLHGLDRFSTDLDFSLRRDSNFVEADLDAIAQVLHRHLIVDDYKDKRFTWFWSGSYSKGQARIKLEISKRQYQAEAYAEEIWLGLTVPTFDRASVFAHKLCAITDRRELANRDLYDAWWMFRQMWSVNQDLVQERTGMDLPAYLLSLLDYVRQNERGSAVDGLGELLTVAQKDWVKDHLFEDLVFYLRLKLQELG